MEPVSDKEDEREKAKVVRTCYGALQNYKNYKKTWIEFGMIFHKKIPSENWTHPPTSIVISDFGKKNSLHSP